MRVKAAESSRHEGEAADRPASTQQPAPRSAFPALPVPALAEASHRHRRGTVVVVLCDLRSDLLSDTGADESRGRALSLSLHLHLFSFLPRSLACLSLHLCLRAPNRPAAGRGFLAVV